jgi:hypothetical protein
MPEETQKPQRLDPSDPLVIDVHRLARRPGSMLRDVRTVPAPADLGLDVIGVPEGADLELNIKLEAVMEGVLVSGTARGPLTGECVRCLDPLARTAAAARVRGRLRRPVPPVRGAVGGRPRARARGRRPAVGGAGSVDSIWRTAGREVTQGRRTGRGRSQAQDVAQQHAQPPRELEGRRADPRHLRPLPRAQAPARRVPDLRYLQQAPGPVRRLAKTGHPR